MDQKTCVLMAVVVDVDPEFGHFPFEDVQHELVIVFHFDHLKNED
jgi:hypothetical protein